MAFDFPPRVGGIQTLVLRLATGLPTLTVLVIAPAGPGAAAFDAAIPARVVRVAPDPSAGPVHKVLCLLAMLARSIQAAWRGRPRVTLCSHVLVAPIGWVVRALFGVPYVVYVYADELVRLGGVRARALRAAERVIAISRYTKELAVRIGVTPARVAVIGLGADPAASPIEAAQGRGDAVPTILTVARMDELYKGQDVLIRSLPLVSARVPGVRLVLVGDGAFRDYYQRLATSLGVSSRVLFTGVASDAERDRWLATCDVFAMPSRADALDGAGEGFGIVYLEAAIREKPVLAAREGGALDAVVGDLTGLLVDPRSIREVADGLVRLLTDPDLARRLGRAGRRRATAEFTWAGVGARVETVLGEIGVRTEAARG